MNWDETILDRLPPQRDNEPSSLRRDIADELADHLACAAQREERQHDDPQQIRQNVLKRFGDPRRIAFQLWFDAMKESIMKDRVFMIAVVVLVLICGGLAWLTWSAMQHNQQINTALLARLEQLTEAPQAQASSVDSMEWVDVKVRLVDEAGDPMTNKGFKIALEGKPINPAQSLTLPGELDDQGVAAFSLIRPGQYDLFLKSPWGHSTVKEFVALPGKPHEEKVVCPTAPPPETEVKIRVNWPEDLRDKQLFLLGRLTLDRKKQDVDSWRMVNSVGLLLLGTDDSATNSLVVRSFDSKLVLDHPNQPDNAPLKLIVGKYDLQLDSNIYLLFDNVAERESVRLDVSGFSPRASPASTTSSWIWLTQVHNALPPPNTYKLHTDQGKWTFELPDEYWDSVRESLWNKPNLNAKEKSGSFAPFGLQPIETDH